MRRDQDELSSPHQRSDRVRSGSGSGFFFRNTELGTWPLDGVSKVEVCMDDGIVGGPGTGRDYPRPFPTFIF